MPVLIVSGRHSMTFYMTPENLQEMAVEIVRDNMVKKADLSELIAKKACDLELNSDQIKRVVETSNTLAYLRKLEDATDRSFEFPVAEYRDVMGRMVLPGQTDPVITKSADQKPVQPNPLNGEAPESVIASTISKEASEALLLKEAFRIKQTLVKMAGEGQILTLSLETLASKIQKDPLAFEKLAHVAEPEYLDQLTILCGLEKKADSKEVFTDSELKEAISLNSLFKEAQALVKDQKEKEEFVKRAFSALGLVGQGVGYLARKAGAGAVGIVKSVGSGLGALPAGKTLSQKAEHALDIGAAGMSALSMQHENGVWQSIHG